MNKMTGNRLKEIVVGLGDSISDIRMPARAFRSSCISDGFKLAGIDPAGFRDHDAAVQALAIALLIEREELLEELQQRRAYMRGVS